MSDTTIVILAATLALAITFGPPAITALRRRARRRRFVVPARWGTIKDDGTVVIGGSSCCDLTSGLDPELLRDGLSLQDKVNDAIARMKHTPPRGSEATPSGIHALEAEILRLRTTETASSHALDTIRQELALDLIPGEHPRDTATRVLAAIREEARQ